jgi:hypothetical protein
MADTSADSINKALGLGALGFGIAGIVAPTALRRSYGMSADGPELTYIGRMWGTRMAVLGALSISAATAEDRKRMAMLAIGMNVVDALTAARTDGLPTVTRAMGTLTSAGFAAAGVYAVMNS